MFLSLFLLAVVVALLAFAALRAHPTALRSARLWLRMFVNIATFPLLYAWRHAWAPAAERKIRPLLPMLGLHFMAQFDDELVTKQLESLGIICKTVAVNAASLNATSVGVGTVAVAGLTPSHKCFISSAAAPSVAVAVVGARCAAAGTLTVDFVNPSAGTLDLASQNFNLLAIPGELN